MEEKQAISGHNLSNSANNFCSSVYLPKLKTWVKNQYGGVDFKKLVVTMSFMLFASNVIASDVNQDNTKETLHLFSTKLMDLAITPSKEGCVIFDKEGNKLTFPNWENENLLSKMEVAFTKECLSFDISK
ncbi:hypothetical protein [Vibrio cholerae]|uniref:hypothetical protein n=1 Tax=Vibrio cholerae TaxID=666 RepID=UPI000E64D746|nr:hypothetical protein [Vibrio cholerae]